MPPPKKRLSSLAKALQAFMDTNGLRQKDLYPWLGPQQRVSNIMNGHTRLTQKDAQLLHNGLGIPLEAMGTPKIKTPN